MHLRSFKYFALGLPLLAVTGGVLAAIPSFWTLENQADFIAGEVEGLSIASEGTISLAPATRNLYEATDPFFWSLVSDDEGNLYAGSGNDGKVYKISPSGDAAVVADTNELEVHALAIDRDGNLFAGTSPRGRVFKIRPDGNQEVFFDPEDRYVWALDVDSMGNVLVATGEKASLYRVSPSGQSQVLFASQETHLVCLTTDSEGNIYAGSDSNGLVFKISRDGRASVLFDTPFEEIHAIVLDMIGNVYAAAVNGERPTTPLPSPVTAPRPSTPATPGQPPIVSESVSVTVTTTPSAAPTTAATSGSGGLKGALFRISPEGSAERLWESREDIPLSLKLETDDRLMVGTGKDGRIFLVRQNKTSSLLLRVEADQVTSIHATSDGPVFFATSNPARIYRLADGRRGEGTYRSPIKDTKTVSSLGKIRWEARVPQGTGLVIQTRTGNSAKPDNTWSDWSAAYTIPEGEQITSPRGRFLQWRAIFKSSAGKASPELLQLTSVYLQQNLPPLVGETTLYPPGQTFQKPLVTSGQLEILGSDTPMDTAASSSPGAGSTSASITTAPLSLSVTALSRTLYRKGYQTVTWKATDPNDDNLSYDVFYRAEGESLWRLLREDIREPVIAWDTVAMPDGRYKLNVVASDAPSNPVQLALTAEKETRSFDVDYTPPRIIDIRASRIEGGAHRVQFQARDDSSVVRKVEYSVDSGKWNVVYPTDGICDSELEELDISVTGYTEGVHILVAKVTDLLSNVATARVELR